MTAAMESVFKSDQPKRDKYLSRLFGIFNEDAVRFWCADDHSPYEDMGRPTLRANPDERGHTLDFTFRRHTDKRVFVGELKCELEYEGYRYLRLTDPRQLDHHLGNSAAFGKFLTTATDPGAFDVRISGEPVLVHGAILVWGAVDSAGAAATTDKHGFADILSIESIIADLNRWRNDGWMERVDELRKWSIELFDFLGGSG